MAIRCRRYHPVWLTHAQISDLTSLVVSHQDEGSYWGPQEQHYKRIEDIRFALNAADFNCVDEMERP